MANPIEIVKAHPWLTGAGVVALVIIFIVAGSGGGSQTVSDGAVDNSQVAAGLQMQQISAAASAAAAETAAKRELGLATIAAQLETAKLESENAFNANTLAHNLGLATLATNEKITTLASTLDAQVKGQEIAAEVSKNQSMFDYLTMQTQSQVQIANAGYNAQIEASKPKGLFSWLFG